MNKMDKVVLLIIALLSFSVFAEEEKKLPPLDPAYEGIHGMALLGTASNIFASHLPLYNKPHDAQIIYKVKSSNTALYQLVKNNDLVTIKPEKFNLQRLMRGEPLVINAQVYIGHFERDGLLVYESMPIELDEQVYFRKLDELKPASNQQEYDMVSYNRKNDRLFIHRIQQAPSFDHIIHISLEASCLTKFTTTKQVPSTTELQYKFIHCGTIRPLYYETQDFAKKKVSYKC